MRKKSREPPLPLPSSLLPGASPNDNQPLETPDHESLFDRLRRKLSNPKINSQISRASELSYEDYLQEKEAALAQSAPAPDPQPLAPGPCNSDPEPPPNPDEPVEFIWQPGVYPEGYLFAVTHGYWPNNPPKHIPDRHWEEDFGNPRKIKGGY